MNARESQPVRPRIVLADDHLLMAQALERLLQPDYDVVAVVTDGRALLQAVADLTPDLAVVDIGMPLLNGLDAGDQLKRADPRVKVIFLTQNREPQVVAEALRRKASGYLLKDSAASELQQAIREALRGGCYVSAQLKDSLTDAAVSSPSAGTALSAREREVLQLLAEGKSMKEVAAVLEISPRTVEFHKYRLMQRLGAKTNADLVQYALKHGLIGS
jgi:DNA-binding NarL/FixJ family response regulator